ncbi:MAG: peptidyl-prolyl cis-trans isomerase D [Oleiphilaceae bacterium]|jgi:peptidyl-prolyl cis-trans isomerase D
MLQDIRKNSQGTVAKLIVGLIVVVFALFGVESIVGGIGGEPEIATVNGEEISQSGFLRAVEGKRRQIMSQMGENADPDLIDEGLLRSSVLEGMINEEILVQDSASKGLFVSEMAVDDYIRGIEQFQVDGQFSNEQMQMLLRNAGLTLQSYRDSLKSQFVLGQSRSGLIASAFVLDNEAGEIIALDRQTRSFGMATVYKSDYKDSIVVTDEEVSAFYEPNKNDYKKPENVEVSYLVLDRADLEKDINIKDSDLKKLYESEKQDYQGDEQRGASHILIKIDDKTSDTQALEKIKEVQAKLTAGESFGSLAEQYSDDEGSAQNSGSLGLSSEGVYVSDFEAALFALAVGEVSKPVKTEFGYHLIRLDQIEANEVPSFDEMKELLESRLLKQKVDEIYAQSVERLSDISYSSPDLGEAAEVLGLEVKSLFGVSTETKNPLFSNRKVQKELFSNELVVEKHNSELIEVEDGKSLVFRVDSYHPETIQPLNDVKEVIRNSLKLGKSSEFAQNVGLSFIERVKSGELVVEVSDNMGLNWKEYSDIRRDNVMLNREAITKIFTVSKNKIDEGHWFSFEASDGDYTVVRLTKVINGDVESINALEKSSISNMIGDTYGAGDYQVYQKVALDSAVIERRNKSN